MNLKLPVPSLLEQLGALCSLLAHDLANQLCVISGSASFAQMVANDPHRLNSALDTIARATERAGHAVSSFSEYRRTLPASFPAVPASEITQAVVEYAKSVGWKSVVPRPVSGYVIMPKQWAVFAMRSIGREIRSKSVTMLVSRQPAPTTQAPAQGKLASDSKVKSRPSLHIRLTYPSKTEFSIQEVRALYENLELLSVFELNRMLGGSLESGALRNGLQAIDLWLPDPEVGSTGSAREML